MEQIGAVDIGRLRDIAGCLTSEEVELGAVEAEGPVVIGDIGGRLIRVKRKSNTPGANDITILRQVGK